MKQVFAYTRVSTARQGTHGSSLEEQKSAIKRYASSHNLNIKCWFEERETAAKRGRPVFNTMLSRMKRGDASGVIIHKIDRSARNLRDWADLGELVDHGVEIHLAHESLDMNSRGGRLAADIQAVVAADYVRNLRQEVIKGMRGRLKQGLFPWAAPVGYLDQGGGNPKVIDPVSGPMVKRLFELYATGEYSQSALAKEANLMGLRGTRHAPMTKKRLSTIFTNTFYIGILKHGGGGESFLGVHEPLISNDLFEQVNNVLSARQVRRQTLHSFPYRQKIRCKRCHRSLIGERHSKWVYYRCHSGYCQGVATSQEKISVFIRDYLCRFVLSPTSSEALRAEFDHLLGERHGDQERMYQSQRLLLSKCENRLRILNERYLEGDFERDFYLNRKEELIGEQAGIKERMTELEGRLNPLRTKLELFLEFQKPFYKSKNLLSEEQLAQLVSETCSNFLIEAKNLSVEPKMAFQMLQNVGGVRCGGPSRAHRRSSQDMTDGQSDTEYLLAGYHRPKHLSKEETEKLATDLYNLWWDESFPLERPHVPMSTRS